MNKVMLMGRLTREPEIRYTNDGVSIASFSLAVDRRFTKNGGPTADFFDCTAFGKQAEFVEKWLHKGTKIVLTGRIENNNYTNKDGVKVYSVRITAEELEFAESKAASGGSDQSTRPTGRPAPEVGDGFMEIPDGAIDDELPFM